MITLLFCLLLLLFPAVIITCGIRFTVLNKVGMVTLAFMTGIGCALLLTYLTHQQILLPAMIQDINTAQTNILDISIVLALPLLIFSFHIINALKHARSILFAMLLSIIAMSMTCVLLAYIYQDHLNDVWQHASLALGAYVGGGINMAVISKATGADNHIFIAMNSYDILVSALYLVFIMSIGTSVVNKILPKPLACTSPKSLNDTINQAKDTSTHTFTEASNENADTFIVLAHKSQQKYNFLAILLSGVILASSLALARFAPQGLNATVTIVSITILAMVASLTPLVQKLKHTYHLGMYLVMVFCFTVGSMVDIGMFSTLDITLFSFIGLFISIGFSVHLLLCALFKVDSDSFLLTSVASIMSVPFIPMISNRLHNRELLVAGLSIAILGYIIGTYLGIAMAYALQVWLL